MSINLIMDTMMQNKINIEKNVGGSIRAERKHTRRSAEERRRIVEETFTPGVSVAAVGRRHGINANQIFTWRKQYLAGKLGSGTAVATGAGFVPVEVVVESVSANPAAPSSDTAQQGSVRDRTKTSATADHSPWSFEIELSGGVKARFPSDVDAAIMRRVLSVVREFA